MKWKISAATCAASVVGAAFGGWGVALARTRHERGGTYLPMRRVEPTNSHVFLDISVRRWYGLIPWTDYYGRVEIELFDDCVPLTAANFYTICRGECHTKTGTTLTYAGVRFHRIIPDLLIQGGDLERDNGTGGASIYGTYFNDEASNKLPPQQHWRGSVSMANFGPNTNASQFFILTADRASHLDGRYVVCGQVIRGMEIVDRVSEFGRSGDGIPTAHVFVSSCGVSKRSRITAFEGDKINSSGKI